MVQLKSQELSWRRDRSDAEKSQREYEERLETESSRARILENVIEDKKAELSVAMSDKTALSEQVARLRETNEQLERQRVADARASVELRMQVEKLVREYVRIEESFRMANKRLCQFDQRLEFAKNRLGLVKALYSKQRSNSSAGSSLPPPPPAHPHPPPLPPPSSNQQLSAPAISTSLAPYSLNTISMLSSIHGSANLNDAQISSLDIFGERNQRDEDEQERIMVRFLI